MIKISVEEFSKRLDLTTIVSASDDELYVKKVNINRPGLQLAGFFEDFKFERLQVFGQSEMLFYATLSTEKRNAFIRSFFSYELFGIVICRSMQIPQEIVDACREKHVPLFSSSAGTSEFITDAKDYFSFLLAEKTTVPGELLDVLGLGILITGESGIGKSETALELIRHGHRLVADDAVDLINVGDRIIGSAPETIRYLMEIRGLGIIDVRQMFGVSSVLQSKTVSLIIELVHFDKVKEMGIDRLDREKHYENLMGHQIRKVILPVAPGRNIASIIEIAVQNLRLDDMGFDVMDEIKARLANQ